MRTSEQVINGMETAFIDAFLTFLPYILIGIFFLLFIGIGIKLIRKNLE